MAARKDSENLTHSEWYAVEALFDLCCSPCAKKNLNKQAVKYCTTCKDYFCGSCVEDHKIYRTLSNHVLLEAQTTRQTSGRSETTQFYALPTKLCKRHGFEVVNMYCRSEDMVGCSVCFLYEHKSCDDIHYIPEYVQSNFPTEQVKQINTDLKQAIKAMTKLKTQHGRLDDTLDKCKTTCKREIQKYRAEINGIIDKIEAVTLAELDARHKDTKKMTGNMNHDIQDLHDEMKRFKSEIESDQSNDSQKFVIAKLSQCLMRKGQELQSELIHDQTTQLTFTRNTDIMTFLLSFVTLGLLSPQPIRDSSLSTANSSRKQRKAIHATTSLSTAGDDRNTNNITTRQQDTTTAIQPKQSLYKVLSKSMYNIKQQDDKNTCNIGSSCMLDNGDILLSDYTNKKLKLVDSRTYTIRSSLVLNEGPQSVRRASSTEAVCLDNKAIWFVSTCDKLVPIRSLSMKHGCICIAVIRDKMYLCDLVSIFVYTLNGKFIQTINKDKAGNTTFSRISNITVSDDENMIHVADWDNGVITLNTDGDVVWRYSGTALRPAWGVCTDGNGTVIVCGYESHNVLQLAPDGQYMGEIVTSSDGVNCPDTVCYDRNNQKLIVGMNDNNITVFTVL